MILLPQSLRQGRGFSPWHPDKRLRLLLNMLIGVMCEVVSGVSQTEREATLGSRLLYIYVLCMYIYIYIYVYIYITDILQSHIPRD